MPGTVTVNYFSFIHPENLFQLKPFQQISMIISRLNKKAQLLNTAAGDYICKPTICSNQGLQILEYAQAHIAFLK